MAMSPGDSKGSLDRSTLPGRIDDWSLAILEALLKWSVAKDGRWTREEPGYLLLEIRKFHGKDIDPILIDTADEELTVSFGYWEAHLPMTLGKEDAEATADEAKRLVERWLSAEIATAVYSDANGKWRGSILIEGGDLQARLRDGAKWIENLAPTHVEVRYSCLERTRRFAIDGEQIRELN